MADPVSGGHGSNGHSNGHVGNGHASNVEAHGHGGVTFEKTDITTGGLYVFGLVLMVVVVGAAGGVHLLYEYLRAEADKQNRNLPTMVRDAATKPGDVLPYGGDENKPLLEGIRGTDATAIRSGIIGYPSLSEKLKKSSAERLGTYGYADDHHKIAHIPVHEAIALLDAEYAKSKPWREKTPEGIEIGSVVNPYSFYRSDSSSGRTAIGETRK